MWTGPRAIGGWEVVGELARGGQGVVLDARDPDGRRAALKLLLGSLGAADPRDELRLEQEARLLAGLSHPGLPRVLGWGRERGLPWLALEKIEGESLERLIARQGPLPPERAAALLAQVARALAHCHARGVLHRDVKPQNVILEAGSGRAVLVDLGLAGLDPVRAGQERERLTRSGELLGTPAYMAPEQVAPGGVWGLPSPASDLWGLGATLHHLLVGAPPYGAQGALALFAAILRDDPPSLAARRPDLPADLTGLCDRCLQRDPALRPASAEHVAEALERVSRRAGAAAGAPRGSTLALLGATAVMGGVLLALAAALVSSPEPSPSRVPAASGGGDELVADVARVRSIANAGDLVKARVLADQGLARWPASADMRFVSGMVHARAGDMARAEEDFSRALTLDPLHQRALVQRGVTRISRGDLAGAEPDLRLALERAPEDGPTWLGLGNLRQARGELREALEAYDRALERGPDLQDARWNRSMVRSQLGDHTGALADLDQLLTVLSEDVEALLLRARVRRRLGGHQSARTDLLRVTELDPGRFEAWQELVEVDLASGDFARAVAACERWGALRPEDPQPWCKAATARLMLQDFAAAERAAEEALRLAPGDPDALHSRAAVKLLTGRAQEALPDLDAALRRDPDHDGALLDRAALRLDEGDPQGAIADAERLLSQPRGRRNAMAHLVRGSALIRFERWAEARAALDRAVALDQGLAQAWHNRAEARRRLGDLEGARADVRSALTLGAKPDCVPRLLPDQRQALEALARELGLDPDQPGR